MNRPGRRRTEELTADLLADMAAPASAQNPAQASPPPPAADGTAQQPPPESADKPPGPAFETTVVVSPLGWHAPRVRLEDAGWVAELGPLRVRFRIS